MIYKSWKRCSLLILLLLALVSIGFAQGEGGVFTSNRLAALKTGEGSLGNNPQAIQWMNELRAKTGALGKGEIIDLKDIEGSVYLEEEFEAGQVFYLDEPYQTFQLRYDAFNDEVEIKRGEGEPLEALHKNLAISCEISGKRLEYHKYLNQKGEKEEGYLFVIYIGKEHSLYKKHSKTFKEGKKAKTSLQNSFPHRFLDEIEYFVRSNGETPEFVKTTKSELIALFDEEKSKKVKSFIKENRLDLNDENNLRMLFAFADSL